MPAGLETQDSMLPLLTPSAVLKTTWKVSTALPQVIQKVVPQCHQSVSVLSLLKPSSKCAQQIISPEPLDCPKPGTVCLLLVPQLPPLCHSLKPSSCFLPVRDKHTSHRAFAHAVASTRVSQFPFFCRFLLPKIPTHVASMTLPFAPLLLSRQVINLLTQLPHTSLEKVSECPQYDFHIPRNISPMRPLSSVVQRKRPRVDIFLLVPGQEWAMAPVCLCNVRIPVYSRQD